MRLGEPTHKLCTKCRLMKPIHLFTMRKRTLASGEVRQYPAGECKKCASERAAEHREKLAEEGKLREREREYNSRRDPEQVREYNRVYQAEQRRKEGVPVRGPWKKYRQENRGGELIDVTPLAEFLEEQVHRHGRSAVCLAIGLSKRRLFDIIERTYPTIELQNADRLLIGLGYPEQLAILYPEEEP